MNTTIRKCAAGLALLLALGTARFLLAQDVEPPQRGTLEIGIRAVTGDREASKFREYRDIPRGFFVRRFELFQDNLLGTNSFLQVQARETLENDQNYLLALGQYGKYRLQFRWNETPHLFTNTAKSFFLQPTPGVFAVPDPIQAALVSDPTQVPALLANNPELDVGLRRKLGTVAFSFMPDSHWNLQVQYSREKQSGNRPFGTTAGGFGLLTEVPEPIDYRTHQLQAGGEYGNDRWGVQFGYSGSYFNNQISTLRWEIPFRLVEAAGSPANGQLDLYPDNRAHSLSFAAAFNLSPSVRLMASIVPGWMRQNDAFLPFTTNGAVSGVPELPATSLNGRKNTLAMNYTVTARPSGPLSVSAKFRSYDYDNDTPSLITKYVSTDSSVSAVERRNLPYAYDRKNLEFATAWDFLKHNSLKVTYEWERMDREHRDVDRSTEHTVGFAFDSQLHKRALFRLSYRNSQREPRHYEANEESFPFGEPATALGQLHELRKFDEAGRKRHRAEALLQLDPTDTLSFSAAFTTTQDDFNKSHYGMLNNINAGYSLDATYAPLPAVSFFGEYARERYNYRQRSRQRTPPTSTAPVNDSENNDWEASIRDLIDTWSAGVNFLLFKRRVSVDSFYSLGAAQGRIHTVALGDPTLPRFLVTSAQDYPDTSNRFHQLVNTVKFRLPGSFSPRFEYRFEDYGRMDFQIDPISQYMFALYPTDTGIRTLLLLGADAKPYRTHVLEVGLEYRF